MFSNLSSYFWGGGSAATPQDGAVNQETSTLEGVADISTPEKIVETVSNGNGMGVSLDVVLVKTDEVIGACGDDEDWLMVDSSAGSEEDKMEEAEVEEQITPLRPVVDQTPSHPVGMEESWIIAPTPTTLPCLVESAMEVSPLETLLIEHPSMSVYHKIDSPVRSLKLSTPTQSSKPEAPTIVEDESLLSAPSVQPQPTPSERSQKKLVVKKPSNQKSSKHPAKPPQIPFILQQKTQKNKPVPEPTPSLTPVVAKPKTAAKPVAANKQVQVVVPNKTPKAKSKKINNSPSKTVEKVKPSPAISATKPKPLGEIQLPLVSVPNSTPKVSKKPTPAPMNRIVESNIKEMYPAHVYPKDMRPFVEDFQNNVNTRQHRELIAAQRRSQLAMTRAKRVARRNPFNVSSDGDETDAAVMMEQKENNVVEMRRQEQFEILLRSSQKQQRKRIDKNLHKNNMCRSNKAIHELSSRNKRQRRSDHANRPSGANNNRKVNTQ